MPTNDELLSLEGVSSPVLSPDATSIVYTVTSTDWDADRFVPQLHLALADGGSAARQLTTDPQGATSAAWSPDGGYITFIASRNGGTAQVYALPLAGGEAITLSASDRGVSGYAWSDDGSVIAFLALEPETDEWKARKETFGDFVITRSPHTSIDQDHTHIFTLDVAAALAEGPQEGVQRTSGREFTCSAGLQWAPGSSTKLAFVGTDNPDLISGQTATVRILKIDGNDGAIGEVTPLIVQGGSDGAPRWSPCGRYIAYTSQIGRTANALNSIICVLPAIGGGTLPLELSHGFDENPSMIDWTMDQGILFNGQEKTAAHLFCCGPMGDLGAAFEAAEQGTPLPPPPIIRMTGPDDAMLTSFSCVNGMAAAVSASSTALPEVVVSPIAEWSPRLLSSMTDQIAGWPALGGREVISWESEDGATIEGILITPPGL